uniref:Uncharacterized protein n=1 Tax=Cryptomonas curvata TaxID=233186 RepID=A0A7S0QQU1_9CRYP|mmetsp:Transcript_45394/g.95127  ORF Transcript_45394/g.95127 Transcript_45394/m.95127 type:complete len:238 (+) Transcript_45394:709-1422(+)
MYPSLIRQGLLEAYVVYPPPLVQDAFWGSDANRRNNEPFQNGNQKVHVAVAPICDEHRQSFQLMELRQTGRVLGWSDWLLLEAPAGLRMQAEALARNQGHDTVEDDHLHVVVLRFPYLYSRNTSSVLRPETAVYRTRSINSPDFDVEVGRWMGRDCEGLIVFGPASECSLAPEARKGLHDNIPSPYDSEQQPGAADWCVIEVVDEGDEARASARRVLLFLEPFNVTHSPQPNLSCHS